jgi:hypothetical protein
VRGRDSHQADSPATIFKYHLMSPEEVMQSFVKNNPVIASEKI